MTPQRLRRLTTVPLVLLFVAAGALPLACGKKDNWPGPKVGLSVTAGLGGDGGPDDAAPSGDGAIAITSDAGPAGDAALAVAGDAAPSASGAPSASAGVVDLTDAALEQQIKTLAAKHAPGMQAEGQPIRADLQEGGHAVALVTLQPGKCYTIIGASPKPVGVKDLDVKLLAPPFFTLSAGEDGTADNTPMIGKAPKPLCPALPLPLAYKVDVVAKKGAGRALVQVFSKLK